MKPNEVYSWTPIKETKETWNIDFVLEAKGIYWVDEEKNEHVTIKFYADHPVDFDRCFKFFSVWFDDKPFMLCEVAGRPDHQEALVTNWKTYDKAIAYIKSLSNEDCERRETIDPDEDCEGLGEFYGTHVSAFYNSDGVDPKYKVGDIVIVRVPKSLGYKPKMIETPVHITRVEPYNPCWTYHGIQIARKCADNGSFRWVDCPVGEGSIGAQFNDEEVVGPYKGED